MSTLAVEVALSVTVIPGWRVSARPGISGFRVRCYDGTGSLTAEHTASAHVPLAVLPERPAQLALQDLAGTRERQRCRGNVGAARAFVAGNQRLAVLHQLLRRGAGAALHHHDSVDLLAPALAWNADHGALRHCRMLRQRVLDLRRIDVLATRDDHVLDAVDDVDKAVLVQIAAVAGVHPAVDHGACGLLGALPIAHH